MRDDTFGLRVEDEAVRQAWEMSAEERNAVREDGLARVDPGNVRVPQAPVLVYFPPHLVTWATHRVFVIEYYCTDPGICPIPLSFKSKLRQWWYTKGASHSTSNDSPHVWRAHEAGQREHSTKSWRVDISSPLITGQLVNETVFLSFNGVVFFSELIYAIAIWVKATSCRNSIGPSMYCWLDGTCNFSASTSVWAQRSMLVFLPKTKITGRRQVLHGIRYSLEA